MKFRVLIFLNLSLFSIFNARYNKALQIVQLFIPENKMPVLFGVDKNADEIVPHISDTVFDGQL